MAGLSRSKEEYLKAIYQLAYRTGKAAITDIAQRMGVSKASASCAVSDLEKRGLVMRDASRRVVPTHAGQTLARTITGRYDSIYRFMREVLHVRAETCAQEACVLEHLLSDASVVAIRRLLDQAHNTQ